MVTDDTYIAEARRAVDQFFWTRTGHDEAAAAVAALDAGGVWAHYLGAQLAYTRLLFDVGPRAEDRATSAEGFRVTAQDPELRGWGLFWQGIHAENIEDDMATAAEFYRRALAECGGDLFLESYVVRHLGGQAAEAGDGEEARRLFRRSLHLRSALGQRRHVAAAQVALAGQLDIRDPERADLLEAARYTAEELGLEWLRGAIGELEVAAVG
jgi:hypothetical protein